MTFGPHPITAGAVLSGLALGSLCRLIGSRTRSRWRVSALGLALVGGEAVLTGLAGSWVAGAIEVAAAAAGVLASSRVGV